MRPPFNRARHSLPQAIVQSVSLTLPGFIGIEEDADEVRLNMFSPVPIFPEYSLNTIGLSLLSRQSYSHSSIQEICGLFNAAPSITLESIIDHILTVVPLFRIVEGAA